MLFNVNINYVYIDVLFYKSLWIPFMGMVLKILAVCLLAIAIRGTVPRYRFDQATLLNWKHFIFIWLLFLLLAVMFVMFNNYSILDIVSIFH